MTLALMGSLHDETEPRKATYFHAEATPRNRVLTSLEQNIPSREKTNTPPSISKRTARVRGSSS